MCIEILFICSFVVALGFIAWLLWQLVRSPSDEVSSAREPKQFRVQMFSGGISVVDQTACKYSIGPGQIYFTCDKDEGFKTGCICVSGDYVLETISASEQTEPFPTRVKATLLSNGVAVKTIEAIAYSTDTSRVFLTTTTGSLSIMGGSFVLEAR